MPKLLTGETTIRQSVWLAAGTRYYCQSYRVYPCGKPPWKVLHGIPWRIRTSISMEFLGNFSIDFHGKYLHGGLGHFPWKTLGHQFPWNSMEISASTFSMEKFHAITQKLLYQLFHGSPGSFMKCTGITHLKYPVNQMEYITDFGPLQFI